MPHEAHLEGYEVCTAPGLWLLIGFDKWETEAGMAQQEERKDQAYIPCLPPCWPQVGSGSVSLLKAAAPRAGRSPVPRWLSLGCSNPSLPCFFSPEVVSWVLAVTKPSASVDLLVFLHSAHSCINDILIRLPLISPLGYAVYFSLVS